MMRSIIGWSMQLRLLVVAAAAVLIFFGATELRQMPIDVVPEFSRPYVEVQTEALGLSAAEVEAMVTVPLEADMLNGVSWVKEIRSESIPGLSSIVLFFEPGVDMMAARQVVQERLVSVFTLPNVSKPPVMMQPVSSTSRFMKVGMTSESRSLIEMSVLARWTIVPRLMGVPGVANVAIWGQRRRQLQVQVDPEELRAQGVTLQQIIHTAGNALWASPLTFLEASMPGMGGWIETPNQRLSIQHLLPISTPEELAQVTVQGTNRALGELSTVVEDHQPLIGDAVVGDAPALMLVVEKFPWANTVDVTAATEEALGSLQMGLSGVKLDSSLFRPATYLELVTGNLSLALLIAFVLAVVVLFGLFFSWRMALISSLAVVVSGLAAVTVLYLRDVPINMMVIAGLMVALAALIDDSIIDIQNIARRLRERSSEDAGTSTAKLIFEAALEMRSPILYATLIALLVVVPIYFMQGLGAAFAQPIALAYALALLASVLVALVLTPALSLLLLADAAGASESPLVAGIRRGLDGLLQQTTRAWGTGFPVAIGAVGLVVVVGLVAFAPSGQSLIPQFRERDILIDLDGLPGTSEEAMRRITTRASRELRAIPGVRTVSAHLGRAVMSDRVNDVNTGELWVSVDHTADYDATVAAIRAVASGYPGFDIDVDNYLNERIMDVANHDEDLVVRVYGENLDKMIGKAEEVQQLLSRVDGVVDAEVQYPEMHPTLEVAVNLAKSRQYGVKPGDVRRAATTLLSGIHVGSLFEDQKIFDVVVWGTPETRRNVTDVEELLIDTPRGGHARLKDVADLRIRPAPKVINREAVARHIDVTAGLAGRSLAAVSAEIQDRLPKEIEFPLEFRAEVLRTQAEQLAADQRVRAVAIGAALAILLLLQAAFGSWRLAFSYFLTVPIALTGGMLASLAAGGLSSLGAVLGLVAVLLIAVRNGFTLIQHYRRLEGEAGGAPSAELVKLGTSERMVPMLMTALVTAVVFLPFVIFGNIAGHEILHPMAIVVLGGLVSSTLVNLFVVPSLYLAVGGRSEPFELDVQEAA